MDAKFEVGQAVTVVDRGHTYAGEIVKVARKEVDIRYVGRVVRFWHDSQTALGTETGQAIYFRIPDDADRQDRMTAARQVLASHGVELNSGNTFTVEQVETLVEVVKTWQA